MEYSCHVPVIHQESVRLEGYSRKTRINRGVADRKVRSTWGVKWEGTIHVLTHTGGLNEMATVPLTLGKMVRSVYGFVRGLIALLEGSRYSGRCGF